MEGNRPLFNAFGAGSRTCLGMHLARMEMRYAVAHFFRNCAGARLASSTTSESMEMPNFFLISPKSGKC
jgi:cytochrome P450